MLTLTLTQVLLEDLPEDEDLITYLRIGSPPMQTKNSYGHPRPLLILLRYTHRGIGPNSVLGLGEYVGWPG